MLTLSYVTWSATYLLRFALTELSIYKKNDSLKTKINSAISHDFTNPTDEDKRNLIKTIENTKRDSAKRKIARYAVLASILRLPANAEDNIYNYITKVIKSIIKEKTDLLTQSEAIDDKTAIPFTAAMPFKAKKALDQLIIDVLKIIKAGQFKTSSAFMQRITQNFTGQLNQQQIENIKTNFSNDLELQQQILIKSQLGASKASLRWSRAINAEEDGLQILFMLQDKTSENLNVLNEQLKNLGDNFNYKKLKLNSPITAIKALTKSSELFAYSLLLNKSLETFKGYDRQHPCYLISITMRNIINNIGDKKSTKTTNKKIKTLLNRFYFLTHENKLLASINEKLTPLLMRLNNCKKQDLESKINQQMTSSLIRSTSTALLEYQQPATVAMNISITLAPLFKRYNTHIEIAPLLRKFDLSLCQGLSWHHNHGEKQTSIKFIADALKNTFILYNLISNKDKEISSISGGTGRATYLKPINNLLETIGNILSPNKYVNTACPSDIYELIDTFEKSFSQQSLSSIAGKNLLFKPTTTSPSNSQKTIRLAKRLEQLSYRLERTGAEIYSKRTEDSDSPFKVPGLPEDVNNHLSQQKTTSSHP